MATGSTDSGATQPDVTLVGAGLTLVLDILKPPSSAFEVRSIALDTSSAWRTGTLTGALADETQIRQVLADLTALRIRGEFTGSPDTAYLDNVRFLPAGSVIPPTIATVRLGKLSSGTVANLGTTDGTSLVVCKYVVPNQSTPPVSVELEALLPEVPTGHFGFRTFSKTTNNGLFAQRVELWDWQAGRWDPVDTVDQPVTTTPTFATVTATAPFDRYWNDGAVKARYRIRATGPVSTLLWCHELDHAAWTVDNGPG